MPQQFHLVHGIRAKDKGAQSMGKLKKLLSRSFDKIHIVSYGYVLIPITNKKAVNAIIKSLNANKNDGDEVVIVAYSNGCWAAMQVAEMGYKIDHLVLISPALYRSHAIPEQVGRMDVFYSPGDTVVELGGLYRRFINIMPWNWSMFGGEPHEWGAMGRYGYQGNDKRVHNWNMGQSISHFWYKNKLIVRNISDQLTILYDKESNK